MKVEFTPRFRRDLRRQRNPEIRRRVEQAILDLEAAPSLAAVSGAARLRAPGLFYRVRIGNYRIGLTVEGDTLVLIRFLHRRDMYRVFP